MNVLDLVLHVTTRLAKLLMAIALAASIGFHWAFFQSVAWVGMVVRYSQQAPFREALVKTFDGKHPCSLCKTIAKERKEERKPDRQFEFKKLEFVSLGQVLALIPPGLFHKCGAVNDCAPQLPQTPPVPPPRLV
jgi:hypothetical protein